MAIFIQMWSHLGDIPHFCFFNQHLFIFTHNDFVVAIATRMEQGTAEEMDK